MWTITPPQQTTHDLDVARAEAKARSSLDAESNARERRRQRRRRERNQPSHDLEVDTFERVSNAEVEE